MSEITMFRNQKAVVPNHVRNNTDDLTKRMLGTGGGSKRISIRGNVFRMIVNGQEVAKSDDRSMDVVVVNAAENVSRIYYGGTYKEGEVTKPDCFSNDGTKPDPRATNPQSHSCANCPMNAKGSGQGVTRACRFSQRLAVVLANNSQDPEALTANLENSDVYQLVLPAQSVFGEPVNGMMPFRSYLKFLYGHGAGIRNVITEMRFDTNSATPKLFFRPVDYLTDEQYAIVLDKGQSEDAQTAISYNPADIDSRGQQAAPAPRPAPAIAPPTPAPVPVEAAPAPVEAAPVAEPTVKEKKSAPAPKAAEADLESILAEWGDDD